MRIFPFCYFFSALPKASMMLISPPSSRPRVTNSNHTVSELSSLSPQLRLGSEDHYNRLQYSRCLAGETGGAELLCPPTPPQMSSVPSFPHGESLLMKELVSLRRGRGAIKMKTRGEVRRTGR